MLISDTPSSTLQRRGQWLDAVGWDDREENSGHSTPLEENWDITSGGSTGPLVDCAAKNQWEKMTEEDSFLLLSLSSASVDASVWFPADESGWIWIIFRFMFSRSVETCWYWSLGLQLHTARTQLVAFICVFTDPFLYFHIRHQPHHPSLHLAADLIRPGLNAFLLLLSDWLSRSLPEQADECWASLRDTSVLWICTDSILCMHLFKDITKKMCDFTKTIKSVSHCKIPQTFISFNSLTCQQRMSSLYGLRPTLPWYFSFTSSYHYSPFLFSTAFKRPSRFLSRLSTEQIFSESDLCRFKRAHPRTNPHNRTAVVSAVAFLSATIRPKSQSARTVFTTHNTRFTTQITSWRSIVSTQ